MIKSTFYNLPDAKKQRVVNAIMEEFSKSDSEKISINSIIKRAEISRGSFYQYFDDKLDLVEVVIRQFADAVIEKAMAEANASDGNIFYVYEKLFDIIVSVSDSGMNRAILKNIVRDMRMDDNIVSKYMLTRFKGFETLKTLSESFSRDTFRFNSDYDMICLQQILNSVLKSTLFKYYAEDKDLDGVKENYVRKLDIIRLGAQLQ